MGKEDDEKFAVALTKEACPICAKLVDGALVMNSLLTKGAAQKVKEMHQKVVGYTKEPCDECKELMSKGFLLVGFVESKTIEKKDPYRSGNMWVVTHEYANRLFDGAPPEKGVAFIDVVIAQKLGFEDANLEA